MNELTMIAREYGSHYAMHVAGGDCCVPLCCGCGQCWAQDPKWMAIWLLGPIDWSDLDMYDTYQ